GGGAGGSSSEPAGGGGGGGGGGRGSAAAARSVAQLAEALCRRLHAAVDVLQTVVQTRLGSPPVLECQVAVLLRTYRLLGRLAKTHLPLKGAAAASAPPPPPVSRPFQELVSLVHRNLTQGVYAAVG
ncbi:hypothetical protein Agub_g8800, partial [Astrephomene gubernaculifera]